MTNPPIHASQVDPGSERRAQARQRPEFNVMEAATLALGNPRLLDTFRGVAQEFIAEVTSASPPSHLRPYRQWDQLGFLSNVLKATSVADLEVVGVQIREYANAAGIVDPGPPTDMSELDSEIQAELARMGLPATPPTPAPTATPAAPTRAPEPIHPVYPNESQQLATLLQVVDDALNDEPEGEGGATALDAFQLFYTLGADMGLTLRTLADTHPSPEVRGGAAAIATLLDGMTTKLNRVVEVMPDSLLAALEATPMLSVQAGEE